MGFSDQDVHTRLGGLAGSRAEDKFREAMAAKGYNEGWKFWRYGLDQLNTKGNGDAVATLPAFILHTPDFIGVGGYAYEVQGTKGDVFKFKREKLEALWMWHQMLRQSGSGKRCLRWFLYEESRDLALWVTFEAILACCYDERTEYTENLLDGKDGWIVPLDMLLEREVVDAFGADEARFGGWRG